MSTPFGWGLNQDLLHDEATPLRICIEFAFQYIGEKDQLENEKKDGHFDQDQLPEGLSKRHRTEPVNIKADYAYQWIQKRGHL